MDKKIIGFDGNFKNNIIDLKKWSMDNFIFNKNTVFYNSYEDVAYINKLPDNLHTDECIYRKNEFDTPLSHFMYILLCVGRKMEIDEREILNKISNN